MHHSGWLKAFKNQIVGMTPAARRKPKRCCVTQVELLPKLELLSATNAPTPETTDDLTYKAGQAATVNGVTLKQTADGSMPLVEIAYRSGSVRSIDVYGITPGSQVRIKFVSTPTTGHKGYWEKRLASQANDTPLESSAFSIDTGISSSQATHIHAYVATNSGTLKDKVYIHFWYDKTAPALAASVDEITERGTVNSQFTVTATDNLAIDLPSLQKSSLFRAVKVGTAQTLSVSYVSTTSSSGTEAELTYQINAPTGGWTEQFNGAWRLEYIGGSADKAGNATTMLPVSFTVDIPDATAPTQSGLSGLTTIVRPGSDPATFTVTYQDNIGLDFTTFDDNDITITRGTQELTVEKVNSVSSDSGRRADVTYRIVPPEGGWSRLLNGLYEVRLTDGDVSDFAGNDIAAALIGQLTVNVPNQAPRVETAVRITADDRHATISRADILDDHLVDPDGDTVSIMRIDSQPAQGTVERLANGDFVYRAAGTFAGGDDSFQITVTDGVLQTPVTVTIAVPQDIIAPTVDLNPPTGDITSRVPGTTATFTAIYADENALNLATVGAANVSVRDAAGTVRSDVLLSVVGQPLRLEDGRYEVTYQLRGPADGWSFADNGTWTIGLGAAPVRDAVGNVVTLSTDDVATFDVVIADVTAPTVTFISAESVDPELSYPSIVVRYADSESGLSTTNPLSDDDLSLIRIGTDETLAITLVDASTNADGSVTATYVVQPPESGWSWRNSGTWTIQLSDGAVQDNADNSAAGRALGTLSVAIPNQTPLANTDDFSFAEGRTSYASETSLLENDSDPDNDSADWRAEVVQSTQFGSVTIAGDGSFTYTPTNANFIGDDSFTYRITDGTSWSQPVSVSVQIAATRPAGMGDSYRVDPGTQLAVFSAQSLLKNDIDPNGRTLTATLVDDARHGTLRLDRGGSFTYLPEAGFTGKDRFTYVANNGDQTSDPITVEIQVGDRYSAETLISFTSPTGQALSQVAPGQEFRIVISTRDLRPSAMANLQGLAAAYFDVSYDTSLIDVLSLQHASAYNLAESGTVLDENGLVDEAGGFSSSLVVPYSSSAVAVIELVAVARKAGALHVTASPGQALASQFVFFGVPIDIRNEVRSGAASLTIGGGLMLSADKTTVSENGGQFVMTLTRPASDISHPLTVQLQSDDTSELTVPSSVTFAVGQSSATFLATAVDDRLLDGTQSVKLTASAEVYQSVSQAAQITDHEAIGVAIDPVEVGEDVGTVKVAVTRSDADSLQQPVTVHLTLSDTKQGSIGQTVTIPAGQSSIEATLRITDNQIEDGDRALTVSATSANYVDGADTVTIRDVEATDVVVTAFDVLNDVLDGTGQARVRLTVSNQGPSAARNFDIALFHSDDATLGNADDQRAGVIHIDQLAAGETRTLTVEVNLDVRKLAERSLRDDGFTRDTVKVSKMADYLMAVVDPANVLVEQNANHTAESNNSGRGLHVDADDVTFLAGDVTGNGYVLPDDAVTVVSQIGKTVSDANRGSDINRDGSILPVDAVAAVNQIGYRANQAVIEVATVAPPFSIDQPTSGLLDSVRSDLAARLRVSTTSVTLVSAVSVTWPDAGLGAPGVISAQVLTPGFKLTFTVTGQGNDYVYHTNSGSRFVYMGRASLLASTSPVTTTSPSRTESSQLTSIDTLFGTGLDSLMGSLSV